MAGNLEWELDKLSWRTDTLELIAKWVNLDLFTTQLRLQQLLANRNNRITRREATIPIIHCTKKKAEECIDCGNDNWNCDPDQAGSPCNPYAQWWGLHPIGWTNSNDGEWNISM